LVLKDGIFIRKSKGKKMAKNLTANARNVVPKGQPGANECWLTAYEMLFNSGGQMSVTNFDIADRLKAGGFDPGVSMTGGLCDEDFTKMSEILNTGRLLPGQLGSIGGMSRNLHNFGVLWLALQIPKNPKKIDGERFKHVIVVLGVDEEKNEVAIVNPWMQNPADYPVLQWVAWDWIRVGLRYTESLDAGCQYYRRSAARTYDER
jgi:Papain-like cysteine protease AvrRpt2